MYQALYRKWRPKTFDDVVGQQNITVTLASEVKSGSISHAYLFTGTRGTGKTTCAKILAKAVNCLNPQNGNPCNVCEICMGIDSGAVMDVAELDAASNNGVDDIRAMIDETNFTPVQAKYRVYIIDEVHMLSPQASNAFLKTLEEPPVHVIFILATTDPQKLLPTVRSRCQRFDFRRIGPEDIAGRLRFIAEREGFSLDEDAASLIARIADGGLRDAVSLLDLCATTDRNITLKTVGTVAGIADKAFLFILTDCIKTGDAGKALELINELHNSYSDMGILCAELINHLRSLMLIKTLSSARDLIVCTNADYEKLAAQAALFSPDEILHAMFFLQETSLNLLKGYNKRTELEIAFIRLCTPSLNDGKDAFIKRLNALEAAVAAGTGFVAGAAQISPAAPAALPPEPQKNDEAPAALYETPAPFELPAKEETETDEPAVLEGQFSIEMPAKEEAETDEPVLTEGQFSIKMPEKEETETDEAAVPEGQFSIEMPPEAAEPAGSDTVQEETDSPAESEPEAAETGQPAEPCDAAGTKEPLACWPAIFTALFELDKPLWGALMNACAYVENGVLILYAENFDTADNLIHIDTHSNIMKKLIVEFCAADYEIRIVKKQTNEQVSAKKASVQGVGNSMNFLNKSKSI